ncbi:PucR family transcriptional regulator ligand-binding domain-containing protein [Solibacillus sp. FSL W8-0474]|uniref:PucR family transcriptional regulator n=1 Tax=Solibacillus sp. FSL W8-0474 TaxID=2975336 RepID=UPI0030F5C57A
MITVKEVLNRKYFESAKVVAGQSGLNHAIKWIHILEVIDVKQLITGNELILTTGVILKDNEQGFLNFVQQLSDLEVAGLCIELGMYIQVVPESVVNLANSLDFPLIVFQEIVPFIGITQDLHTAIIHQQYDILRQLEDYSQKINNYVLKVNDKAKILQYMQKYLNVNTYFEVNKGTSLAIPDKKIENYKDFINSLNNKNKASLEMTLFDQVYGTVHIYSEKREITELDLLILDRTVVTLSQFVLRDLYIEEKLESENRKFFEKWLEGKNSDDEIRYFIEESDQKLKQNGWMVMIHQMRRKNIIKDLTNYKINLRQALQKEGFYTFIVEQSQYLIFILNDLGPEDTYKERMKRAMNELINQYRLDTLIAVGKYVSHYNELKESYQTAQETLQIRMTNMELSYFYDELLLYHMVKVLQNNNSLMQAAKEKIEKLSQYDSKHNTNLIQTLDIYFQCNGLKKETAEKLFIVRQTLYHRLEKVEQIIGNDFMNYENRLCIELMLLMTKHNYYEGMKVT